MRNLPKTAEDGKDGSERDAEVEDDTDSSEDRLKQRLIS